MNFEGMTVEEITEYFGDKYSNHEVITLEELDKAVNATSLVDPVANPDATTIFYSGEKVNALAKSDTPSIRIIDRTDRANVCVNKIIDISNI